MDDGLPRFRIGPIRSGDERAWAELIEETCVVGYEAHLLATIRANTTDAMVLEACEVYERRLAREGLEC